MVFFLRLSRRRNSGFQTYKQKHHICCAQTSITYFCFCRKLPLMQNKWINEFKWSSALFCKNNKHPKITNHTHTHTDTELLLPSCRIGWIAKTWSCSARKTLRGRTGSKHFHSHAAEKLHYMTLAKLARNSAEADVSNTLFSLGWIYSLMRA